jgi:anti-anti-sigma regulatory factor
MISIVYNDDFIIMSLGDLTRIDFLVFEKLKSHLLQIIEDAEADIYVDLREVKFIDSNSFSGFKYVNDVAIRSGFNLYFINVSRELMELFSLGDEENDLNIRSESEIEHLRVVLN